VAPAMGEGTLSNNIVPPIFIVEDDDVIILASVAKAESFTEPIDVKLGGFVAYDSEGRLLRFDATHWGVTVRAAELEPTHASELKDALRAYLKAVSEPASDDPTCDLACLVNACRKFM
jgi:hypothetical protein